MRTITNRQPNIISILDKNDKPIHKFYSLYSLAKWLICSGYSTTPNNRSGVVSLAGGLYNNFKLKKKPSDIVDSYGMRFRWEGHAQPGSVAQDEPQIDNPSFIMVHVNGYVENFKSLNDWKKKYKNDYAIQYRFMDTGKMVKKGKRQFALYIDNGRHLNFNTYEDASNYLHMNETRLRHHVKNKLKVRGKYVTIGKL